MLKQKIINETSIRKLFTRRDSTQIVCNIIAIIMCTAVRNYYFCLAKRNV